MKYLNAGAGQHRRSSELPESEGRTGRGGRRTELYSFPDGQAHTLTHINIAHTNTHKSTHTLTHALLDFRLICGLQKNGPLELYLCLPRSHSSLSSPTSTSTVPRLLRADGHGVGLSRGCLRLCPAGPSLGEQQHGFRGSPCELLPPFQPLLLPVHSPRGAGGSRGGRRWGRGASHPPNYRQPHRLHPWTGVPR